MLPQHVGIILDGNRRFARELMKTPWLGHKMGLEKARTVLGWACERGIKYVTAYVLSLENFQTRPKRELRMILEYFGEESGAENERKQEAHHKHSDSLRRAAGTCRRDEEDTAGRAGGRDKAVGP